MRFGVLSMTAFSFLAIFRAWSLSRCGMSAFPAQQTLKNGTLTRGSLAEVFYGLSPESNEEREDQVFQVRPGILRRFPGCVDIGVEK
jgi:hypothetical protein